MHVLSAALRIPSSPHLKLKVIWGNPNQHPLPPNLCHSKSMDFSGKSFLFHPAGGWTQLSVCTSKLYDGHNYFLNSVTNVILVVLGLRCCAGSSGGEWGLLLTAAPGLLTAVVSSLVAEHRLLGRRASVLVAPGLSSFSSQTL